MKKTGIVVIVGVAILAVIICGLLFGKESPPEGKSGEAVAGTNDKGVTYTATIDTDSVKSGAEAQSVTVTIKTNKKVKLDSLGGMVIIPEGIKLAAMENEKLGFKKDVDYNLENGYLAYATPDADNVSTDYLIKITYSVPAETPAGTYDLGMNINCISRDYGTVLWEEDATPTVTLIVE